MPAARAIRVGGPREEGADGRRSPPDGRSLWEAEIGALKPIASGRCHQAGSGCGSRYSKPTKRSLIHATRAGALKT